MLTKDLLRFKQEQGRVVPRLLKATPAIVRLGEALLQHWRGGLGQTQAELDEGAQRICHGSRSLVVARGLLKLIVDACDFVDATSLAEQRWQVLTLAAQAIGSRPEPTALEHRRRVDDLVQGLGGCMPDDLYGDLSEAARLQSAPDWSLTQLIQRYNLAQVQGLLLSAQAIELTVRDGDPGHRRRLLKQLRWLRLLAEVEDDREALRLRVSGPGSVLDQGQRYGLQLAQFLPAVCTLTRWQLRAEVRPQRGGGTSQLSIDEQLGLNGSVLYTGYVPDELRGLQAKLTSKRPAWQVSEEAPLLPVPGSGEIIVPDLAIELPDGRRFDVECFHRWHLAPLERRLQQVEAGLAPRLLLGVDRQLTKRQAFADLSAQAAFQRQGFLFSSFPTPTAIIKLVEQLAADDPAA